MDSILSLSIVDISQALQQRIISPVELTKLLLEHIEKEDQKFNSYITVFYEEAINRAIALEKEMISGEIRGPLHGVPVAIKDVIFTQGKKTTMGSEIFREFIPAYNARVVDLLEEAGAIIVGKNNTHQFAYGPTGDRSYFGPVRNPHDLSKISGGSSSGSAVAVATNLCYAALGTDTSGSIRIPSSFCGVVGMKPTFGRVSKHGVFPVSWLLDHVGPITKTVRDNALLLNIIAGYDDQDPYSLHQHSEDFARKLGKEIKKAVVGIPKEYYFDNVDKDVRENVLNAIVLLEDLGAEIKEVDLPDHENILAAHQVILRTDAFAIHHENLLNYPDKWDDEVKERILLGEEIKAFEYAQAIQTRFQTINQFDSIFEEIDVFISPTVPILPTNIEQREVEIYPGEHIRYPLIKLTSLANFIGFPSLSVNCGFSAQGLPIGLQIIGKRLDEATVYQFAYFIEQELSTNNFY